jgi:hypothetical protein
MIQDMCQKDYIPDLAEAAEDPHPAERVQQQHLFNQKMQFMEGTYASRLSESPRRQTLLSDSFKVVIARSVVTWQSHALKERF